VTSAYAYYAMCNRTKPNIIAAITWTFQKQISETTQIHPTIYHTQFNLKSSISMRTYTCWISFKGTRIKSAWTSAYKHSTSLKWYFNINKIYERYANVIEQNQKSIRYFMDRTKHNMNFSKANDRNNTNAINKFTTLNLKYNISMRTHMLQIPIDHTVLKKRKN